MKTLDEVIEAMERCSIPHYFDCKGCPYEDDDAEVGCRSDDRDADALHYLKEYQWQMTNPDGDRQQLEKCRALLSDFYRNDPLSWDELRTMEGKPVWVEYNLHLSNKEFRDKSKRWCIIGEFKPWKDTEITITENGFVLSKREQINAWQAYRKERS